MAIFDDANVNPRRSASGHEYKAMPWLHDETQFDCEYCGDLFTLEKAMLRDRSGEPSKVKTGGSCRLGTTMGLPAASDMLNNNPAVFGS
jgi:hypothetical protein